MGESILGERSIFGERRIFGERSIFEMGVSIFGGGIFGKGNDGSNETFYG